MQKSILNYLIFFFFVCLMVLPAKQMSGQVCQRIENSNYKGALVSLAVERENIVTGVPETSYGTGFVISPSGHVLTANHVVDVDDPSKVRVTIKGTLDGLYGEYVDLEVVKNEKAEDVALLKFKASKTYPSLPLGDPFKVKRGQLLCSYSFVKMAGLNFRYSQGPYSSEEDEIWFTEMTSNPGESGAPVFSDLTGRVVAMKYGKLSGPNAYGLFKLTPLNLVEATIRRYTGFRLDDVVQDMPPSLPCRDNKTDPGSPVEIHLTTECNGCPTRTTIRSNWLESPFKIQTNWNATQQGWLSASANASAKLECKRIKGDYRLGIFTEQSSLAGWGGTEGDYRYSESSIVGAASTGFSVTESGKYCLSIKQHLQNGTRRRGYSASINFSEGEFKEDMITLESPNGNMINLEQGTSIPLDEVGKWLFLIEVNKSLRSDWAENSGQITWSNVLQFQFTQKQIDGTCPVLPLN